MTQTQYDRESAAGNIDDDAIYLTPDDSGSTEYIIPLQRTVTEDDELVHSFADGYEFDWDALVNASRTGVTIKCVVEDGDGQPFHYYLGYCYSEDAYASFNTRESNMAETITIFDNGYIQHEYNSIPTEVVVQSLINTAIKTAITGAIGGSY